MKLYKIVRVRIEPIKKNGFIDSLGLPTMYLEGAAKFGKEVLLFKTEEAAYEALEFLTKQILVEGGTPAVEWMSVKFVVETSYQLCRSEPEYSK